MIIGVTGSRNWASQHAIDRLCDFLIENDVTEFHHGDCVGWDHIAWGFANAYGAKTVAHPPDIDTFRAFTKSNIVLPPKPYLDRNKDIVNSVDFLIAAPDGPEKVRSGTWSTIRYAKSVGVKGVIYRSW